MRVQISLTINQCNQLTGLRYPFHWYQEITGQNLQVFLTKRHTLYIALYSSFYISDLFLTITKYRGHLRSYVVYHGFLLDVMPVVVQKLMPLMMERLNIIIKTKIDEHLRTGLQHWRGNGSGKSPYDGSYFKVMDTGSSSFKLKVKEDLHIN